MASVRLTFNGLQELYAALRRLPGELADEAGKEVRNTATDAADEIVAAYPEVTGNLKQHVKVVNATSGRYGAAAKVTNTARHAKLFEYGTQGRPRKTAKGWNRGPMPAGNIFLPIMIRRRRRLQQALIEIVERAGFKVRE